MKKIIAITAVAALGLTSYGQGFFSFSGAVRGAWDDFTTVGAARLAPDINVGFLWGTTGTAAITGLSGQGITGGTTPTNSAGFSSLSTVSSAWTAITTDPNYSVALTTATGNAPVVATTAANGSWSFNGANSFGVQNTAAQNYTVIVFGWSSAYATPALAAAANSPIGWSAPFTYAAASNIGTPLSMPASGLLPFGVTAPVPEPATIALAGLGGLSLLALRRRNSK